MNENEPFLNEQRKKYARYLVWALVTLAVLLSDIYGFRLPLAGPEETDQLQETGPSALDSKAGSLDIVSGSSVIQGEGRIVHDLAEVRSALCAVGSQPTTGRGDALHCTVELDGGEMSVTVWEAGTPSKVYEGETVVYWMAAGIPSNE